MVIVCEGEDSEERRVSGMTLSSSKSYTLPPNMYDDGDSGVEVS